MYQNINEKLSSCQKELFRLQKVEAMLASLHKDRSMLEEKAQSAKSILEKENRDYEKITGNSIAALFYNTIGSLDVRIEKECQESLEARLKYDQCIRDLEDIQLQIDKLESEKQHLQYAPAEYDKLYEEKFRLLMKQSDKTAREIMELGNRIERSKANQREIAEAIIAGRDVQNSLAEASKSLDSAEGWGVWDMFGGGLMTDLIKHSHIDDASSAAQRTQALLRRFRTELADVSISEEIRIDISGFAKFADFFFDGLIADWFMQSKINATQESVRTVQNQVQSVMRKLDELEKAEENMQRNLNAQISRLVVNA